MNAVTLFRATRISEIFTMETNGDKHYARYILEENAQ